jgi:hypothetical protein
MADYRIVKTKFWDDPYITSLDPNQKLLFIYLLTNSCTDISGAYEISIKKIEFDTQLGDSLIQAGVRLFEADEKMIYKDGWLFIPNFIKHQSLNPSVIKGILKSLENVPQWIRDKTDWHRLGTASPQPVGKIDRELERKKETDFIKNSRETLSEKYGSKRK